MYKPKGVNRYKGKQVLINSDRLVFNAKDDSILMYSDKAIGFSTKGSIHFDTTQIKEGEESENLSPGRFVVNSPHIYLGLEAGLGDNFNKDPNVGSSWNYPHQRAVLGNNMRKYLRDVLELIETLIDDLYDNYSVTSAEVGQASAPNRDNEIWMNAIRDDILILKNDLSLEEDGFELGDPDDCVFLSKTVKLK